MTVKPVQKRARPTRQSRPTQKKNPLDLTRLNVLWKAHQEQALAVLEQQLSDTPEGAESREMLQAQITALKTEIAELAGLQS